MFAERGAFLDPAAQRLLLRVVQGPVRIDRRHPLLHVSREDSIDQLTLVRLSGYDNAFLALTLASVEPQPRLTCIGVLTVALVAVLRKNRPHIASKVDRRRKSAGDGERKQENDSVSEGQTELNHGVATPPRNAVIVFRKTIPGSESINSKKRSG